MSEIIDPAPQPKRPRGEKPPKVRVPSYRRHKQSGQAVITLSDGFRRRDVLLGKYGTKESHDEYNRVRAQWEARGRRFEEVTQDDISIAELIARFWPHVESYYRRPDGTKTQEVDGLLYALRPLNYLFGQTSALKFGPIALRGVRDLMVKGYEHPKYGKQAPLARTVINQRVKRIRRMFRWAVEQEIVPAGVLQALQSVQALKQGRTTAYETKPVDGVSRAVVDDTLPLLRPMVADMVRLQLETGMRPGELVIMRAIDIDTTGKVWLYRPGQHKTQHHGHGRIVPIGPRAQEIVKRYLTTNVQAYLFSPAACMAERREAMRAVRKTKVQPSQVNRSKSKPKKKPGIVYTTMSYGKAIAQVVARHNKNAPEAEHIPHWHPHQLRHTRALELKRVAGLDVARAVLGHKSPALTEHYAGLDIATAAELMSKIG